MHSLVGDWWMRRGCGRAGDPWCIRRSGTGECDAVAADGWHGCGWCVRVGYGARQVSAGAGPHAQGEL